MNKNGWFFWGYCLLVLWFIGATVEWFQYRIRGQHSRLSRLRPEEVDRRLIGFGGGILWASVPFFSHDGLNIFLMCLGAIFWGMAFGSQLGGIRKGVFRWAGRGSMVGILLFELLICTTGPLSFEAISLGLVMGILFGGGIGFILGAFWVKEKI